MTDSQFDQVKLITDMTEEEQKQFHKRMEVARGVILVSINEFYKKMSKRVRKAIKKHGDDGFPAPQNFWQEVGCMLSDFLMVGFPMPKDAATITSTRKGHLIPAEFFAFGAMWSCYCAGTDMEELHKALKEQIELKGVQGREEFVKFLEAHTGGY